jgi:hypothetical protein
VARVQGTCRRSLTHKAFAFILAYRNLENFLNLQGIERNANPRGLYSIYFAGKRLSRTSISE